MESYVVGAVASRLASAHRASSRSAGRSLVPESVLVGVNPALDAFTDLAAELKTTAEREAHENGRWLLGNRRAAA
jgi:hypothetical protein